MQDVVIVGFFCFSYVRCVFIVRGAIVVLAQVYAHGCHTFLLQIQLGLLILVVLFHLVVGCIYKLLKKIGWWALVNNFW